MRIIAYNRKINAPIRFLNYLEPFDLFVIMILGVFIPLGAASFMPVQIPIWHVAIWIVVLTMTLIAIKIGRAPGFIQHWLGSLFRATSFHPGKKDTRYFLFNPRVYEAEVQMADSPEQPVSAQELAEIRESVRRLRQARREAQFMANGPAAGLEIGE
jgi:hypothetical protein